MVCCVFAGVVRDGAAAPFLAQDWNPWEDEQVEYNSDLNKKRGAFKQHLSRIDRSKAQRYKVQVWGKAAIGEWGFNGRCTATGQHVSNAHCPI